MAKAKKTLFREYSSIVTSCRPENMERALPLEKVANARDLGGLTMQDGRKIKRGKLLRTAHLHDATDKDLAFLQETCGVTLIIDLRSEPEHKVAPDREIPGARNLWVNLASHQMDKIPTDMWVQPNPEGDTETQMLKSFENPFIQSYMKNYYIGLVTDVTCTEEMSHVFHEILKEKGSPVLWHCTQGKDRCGLISAIMLFILGADKETVLHDFALSNNAYAGLLRALTKNMQDAEMDKAAIDAMTGCFGVKEEYMQNAFLAMSVNYGGIQKFIEEGLHITPEEQKRFRTYYLEGPEPIRTR